MFLNIQYKTTILDLFKDKNLEFRNMNFYVKTIAF